MDEISPMLDRESLRSKLPNSLTTVTTFSKVLALVLFISLPFTGFYLGIKYQQNVTPVSHINNIDFKSQQNSLTSPYPSPIPSLAVLRDSTPSKAVFMREGDIWLKDLDSRNELRISTSPAVENPNFSPFGNFVTYFEISHGVGGFPTYDMYVADLKTQTEYVLTQGTEGANAHASKYKWSQDEQYLGFVIFDTSAEWEGNEIYNEIRIYSTQTQSQIIVGEVTTLENKETEVEDDYIVKNNCSTQPQDIQPFCNEYMAYLEIPRINYKYLDRSQIDNLDIKKTNYKPSRHQEYQHGLQIIEFYTGEPQNPESKWDLGTFVPGYDKGVTETYSVLLDPETGEIINEIENAVGIDYYFPERES